MSSSLPSTKVWLQWRELQFLARGSKVPFIPCALGGGVAPPSRCCVRLATPVARADR